jgi:predicted ATPase
VRRTNLPRERTSFVGRARELAALRALVDDGAQLVTLTGTGGVGKTRLARRYAADAMAHLGAAGGAWFCELSEARSAGEVSGAVAAALGTGAGGDPVVEIGHALAGRGEALLILDNCEQVAGDVATFLERWMDAAPEATFLVTSRERLRLAGECVLEVDPLGLPDLASGRLAASEAMDLFVERARAVRPGWAPDAGEAAAAVALVRRLDGLPLAIELAAARMRMFGVEQLADLVGRRFDLLVGGARGAGARQATLRGAIDWSWALLGTAEKAALAQCAVFRGGFSLDAAEHVLAVPAHQGGSRTELDLLSALHDQSLLRAEPQEDRGGARRYRLLESIREYAYERLEGSERSLALARHAAYYASLGDAAPGSGPAGAADVAAARRLVTELDNLVAVVQRLDDGVEPQHVLQALLALAPIVAARGPLAEHEAALGAALAAATKKGVPASLLARARAARAVVRRAQGRVAEARDDLEAGLALAGGDPVLEGTLVHQIGIGETLQGRYDAAFADYQRALELLEPTGDHRAVGHLLGDIAGLHLVLGQLDEARALLERALRLLRAAGDVRGFGEAVGTLGVVLLQMRRIPQAVTTIGEAIQIFRDVGDRRNLAIAQGNLAIALQEQGRFGEATAQIDASIAILPELGARRVAAVYTGYRAALFDEIGKIEDAQREYEAAIRALRACGDRRRLGLFLGYLGGLLARRGLREVARAHLDEADLLLEGEPRLAGAVGVHRLHLEADDGARLAAARALADTSHQVRFSLRVFDATSPMDADATARLQPVSVAAAPHGTRGATRTLVLARDARWFAVDGGARVDLGRRGALRRILLRLAELRLSSPGVALPLAAVSAAGWPGERMLGESAADRVYTTVQRLRRLGLEEVLLTRDDGYLLDPRVAAEWSAD